MNAEMSTMWEKSNLVREKQSLSHDSVDHLSTRGI